MASKAQFSGLKPTCVPQFRQLKFSKYNIWLQEGQVNIFIGGCLYIKQSEWSFKIDLILFYKNKYLPLVVTVVNRNIFNTKAL